MHIKESFGAEVSNSTQIQVEHTNDWIDSNCIKSGKLSFGSEMDGPVCEKVKRIKLSFIFLIACKSLVLFF